MRRMLAACLVALSLAVMGGMLAGTPAQAYWFDIDTVPALKGNDTGGIIAYPLAIDHCARYGKVVKFLGVQPNYGGYVSFACRWVPYGAAERPLRTLY